MKQVTQTYRSGDTRVEEVPVPLCPEGGVLVANAFSLISAGTERTVVETASESLIGKARRRPDLVRQVLDKARKEGIAPTIQAVRSRLDTPIPLGYSCAGTVIEVGDGIDDLSVGDRVACAGAGHANHAEIVAVPRNLCVRVPDEVGLDDAAFVTVGAIALQGLRVADVSLGERVVVIGLGLVGQLTVQLLNAAGCNVFGIDLDPTKVAIAHEHGAVAGASREMPNLDEAILEFTGGYGADAVLITAGTASNDPIELAAHISRDKGRVVVVGAVGMNVPRPPFYEKELDLRLSRSYGPGRYDPEYEERGVDYPIGYVRWTEGRNMEAFLEAVARGRMKTSSLVTHRFRIEDANGAYDVLSGKQPEPSLAILLEYPHEAVVERRVPVASVKTTSATSSVGIGFIGAGNFSRAVLFPALKSISDIDLIGVASNTGLSASSAAQRFGFEWATSDYRELLVDPRVTAVIIATRHDLHARMTIEALDAGKSVFLEKPLALNLDELRAVLAAEARSPGLLMLGFNRRFAPSVQRFREFFGRRTSPLTLEYRINAGQLPRNHWLNDPSQGGGRIIGEVCHFVDLVTHLAGSSLERVYAEPLGGERGPAVQSAVISLRYADGSIGSINYAAEGDRSFAKERMEVIGAGAVAILDDFRSWQISRAGKHQRSGRGLLGSQDKGHSAGLSSFVRAVRQGGPCPIPVHESALTTLATFKIVESLTLGRPLQLNPSELMPAYA
jgi:predicted dehydrogenase/threonine dehydrogenase-like Zn-dependent dehydrogenase